MSAIPKESRLSTPRHVVIVAHPEPQSFALSVAKTYCAAVAACGQESVLRDLYAIGFDPVLKAEERHSGTPVAPAPDVQAELDLLAGADAFVLVYPLWFGSPPAMIKGYVERVLGAGMSFETMRRHPHEPHPLLGGKQLLSFSSSGARKRWLADQGAWVSLQTLFDGYLARLFWMSSPHHVHFEEITPGIDEAQVRTHLRKVEEQARAMCELLDRHAQGRTATPATAAIG